jgi:hypothetical protein
MMLSAMGSLSGRESRAALNAMMVHRVTNPALHHQCYGLKRIAFTLLSDTLEDLVNTD